MQERTRLMLLMAVHYGSMGLIFPYLPLLLSVHLTEAQLGFALATGPLAMLIFQPLWGMLSDRFGMKPVLLTALGGAVIMLPVLLTAETYTAWLIVLPLYFLFQSPVAVLIDTMALYRYSNEFGRIRLWGSLGFACTVFIGGLLIGGDAAAGSKWIVFASMFLVALAIVIVLGIPASTREGQSRLKPVAPGGFLSIIRSHKIVLLVIVIASLTAFALRGHLNFYSIGLDRLEAPELLLGTAWLLQIVPEIALFLLADRLLRKRSPYALAFIGTCIFLVQYSILGFFPILWAWVVFQPFIGAAYALWYTGNSHIIKRIVPERYQATGLSVYNAAAGGIAGVAGSALGGVIVGEMGLYAFYLVLAGLCSLALALLIVGRRRIQADSAAQDA